MDLEKLWRFARKWGAKKGLADESEDFAQEATMYAFEKELDSIRLDFFLKNYLRKWRAQKRIVSAPQGSISGYKVTSLFQPAGDNDSHQQIDKIQVEDRSLQDVGAIEELASDIDLILSLPSSEMAKRWARESYKEYLIDNT